MIEGPASDRLSDVPPSLSSALWNLTTATAGAAVQIGRQLPDLIARAPRAVEALPEVLDSMVVDLEYLGRESFMPLFVVLRSGLTLDDALSAKIAGAIRTALSPRFVPDQIVQVAEVPRTLSGKKQELPIKKLLLGQPLEKVINKEAMANPGCLDWYVAYAQRHAVQGKT